MSAASRPVAMRTIDWRGARRVASTIHHVAVDVRLGDRVEVHRGEAGRVDRHHAGGHVERAQQGDHEVRVVAAHPAAGEQGLLGAVGRQARAGHVAQPLPDPERDGGEQVVAVQATELAARGRRERVRLAVAARSQIGDEVEVEQWRGVGAGPSISASYSAIISPGVALERVQAGAVAIGRARGRCGRAVELEPERLRCRDAAPAAAARLNTMLVCPATSSTSLVRTVRRMSPSSQPGERDPTAGRIGRSHEPP